MMFTLKDAEIALIDLVAIKGKERAMLIERILRWETNHFKSKQYKLTGSAGMEDGKWSGLKPDSYSTIQMLDNHPEKVTNPMRTFIKWNSVYDFCIYLSDYIDRHNGNFARWNSTNLAKQKIYEKCVNSVKNRIIKA